MRLLVNVGPVVDRFERTTVPPRGIVLLGKVQYLIKVDATARRKNRKRPRIAGVVLFGLGSRVVLVFGIGHHARRGNLRQVLWDKVVEGTWRRGMVALVSVDGGNEWLTSL